MVKKIAPYFQGWYVKHQNGEKTVAFIVGFQIDGNGRRSAFVQVVTDEGSCCVPFAFEEFAAAPGEFAVRVGDNVFAERGCRVNLHGAGMEICGELRYGAMARLRGDIMGPFAHVPRMECSHGVVSLRHRVDGSLWINGEQVDFTDGTGYIESDAGRSFPRCYAWVQCNRFGERDASVMASVAHIPYGPLQFTGCIAAVWLDGREYRLATYRGVKVLRCDSRKIELEQRGLRLVVEAEAAQAHALAAPQRGAMSRTIHESPACGAAFRFYDGRRTLFEEYSTGASCEFVGVGLARQSIYR